MIRFVIFSGWFTSFGISQVDIFDSFLHFLHQDGGVRMDIRYHQEQFGESYKVAGAFYFLEDDYYIYDYIIKFMHMFITNNNTLF